MSKSVIHLKKVLRQQGYTERLTSCLFVAFVFLFALRLKKNSVSSQSNADVEAIAYYRLHLRLNIN